MTALTWIFPAVLLGAAPFGAPLPADVRLVAETTEPDGYGQTVALAIYESPSKYEALADHYRRRMKARRRVRVAEQWESLVPGYVPDPTDPRTSILVLRVMNLDYTGPWAAVYVRPLPDGRTRLAVLERRPPPEVPGDDNLPVRLEIPRAIFDLERPLLRRTL